MAVPKILGVETEYGIVVRGAQESNPISASSVLINAYVQSLLADGRDAATASRVEWDFEDEMPHNDARGSTPPSAYPPEVETHLVNAVLTNGARYYVDHAHPECSTPECADAREIVVWDRAAEEILRRSMVAATGALLAPGEEIVIHKNNSDGKGNSYGCHENYLLSRSTPFSRIVRQITPHFVTRQVYCGAGKVGAESPAGVAPDVRYQLSQRADFFEEEVGLETTLKRLMRMSEKLMQLARAEGSRLQLDTSNDLRQVLHLIVQDFTRSGEERISLSMPDAPVDSNLDPDAFGILCRNLIENALRHGTADQLVQVDLSPDGVLSVRNDGPVLSPDMTERLMLRFERGSGNTDGSGLGLAIVKAIADRADARISVVSPLQNSAQGVQISVAFASVGNPLSKKNDEPEPSGRK